MLDNEVLENALQTTKATKHSLLDEIVISFLEELKQYRAIGTLEECRQAINHRYWRQIYVDTGRNG